MTKFLKVSFLAMLIVAVMALPAFAGTITFWGSGGIVNTKFSVALEAMNAARNYTVSGSSTTTGGNFGYSNAAFYITPGQQLASGSLLSVTFVNAAFDGSSVNLCSASSDTNSSTSPVATYQPTANTTTQSFVLGTTVASGTTLFMTTAGTNCNLTNASFIVRFQPVSSAALASISYSVSLSGTTYDSTAHAVNFANIARQYSTAYSGNNSTIDFSTNSASNGTQFTGAIGGNTSNSATANIAVATMDFPTTSASLTVAAILGIQDSASFQGIKDIYVTTSGTSCGVNAAGANNAIVSGAANLTGTVNLAIPSNAFNGGAAYAANVCVDVLGNTVLQSRTIKGAYTITSGNSDVDSFSAILTWTPNGYQGIIPYINGSSTFDTICFISNKSSQSAPVTVSILSTESGATLTGLQGIAVGTVPAAGTMRVDFTSSVTPYTYAGGVETAGTPIALTGVQGNDRLSAILNIGANQQQVYVNCIQADPAGSKRAVPVLVPNVTSTGSQVY